MKALSIGNKTALGAKKMNLAENGSGSDSDGMQGVEHQNAN